MDINFNSIGTLHTPYNYAASTPFQPIEADTKDTFYIELKPEFEEGLLEIESFNYITIIYYMDRLKKNTAMHVSPPWTEETTVGVFASRSPLRPNPIGMSIVKLIKKENNRLYISALDTFNNTPLLDIKPYIHDLDSKEDANNGWIDKLPDAEHLKLHIRGVVHGDF